MRSTVTHEGQLVGGYVTNVVDFGAFVALDDGLEGLLHLSEMGDGALKEPYSYVQKGDQLSLRISHLEPEKRRVGFTQRWGTELDDEEPESANDDAVEAPAAVEAGAEAGESNPGADAETNPGRRGARSGLQTKERPAKDAIILNDSKCLPAGGHFTFFWPPVLTVS